MRRECRERFSPPPISKETASWRSRHASRHVRDARAVMHVGIAYLRWRGKRSRHSRRMRTRSFTYLARGPWGTCRYIYHVVQRPSERATKTQYGQVDLHRDKRRYNIITKRVWGVRNRTRYWQTNKQTRDWSGERCQSYDEKSIHHTRWKYQELVKQLHKFIFNISTHIIDKIHIISPHCGIQDAHPLPGSSRVCYYIFSCVFLYMCAPAQITRRWRER